MPLRKYKPTTPSRRSTVLPDFSEITKTKPERSLLEPKKRTGGRNAQGRITVRHRGGGHRRHYRRIDFLREKLGVPAKVAAIEYDPNRSARIALLHYVDGEKRYIIAPNGLQVGATLMSGPKAEPEVGNAMAISQIPLGLPVHCIEMRKGRGAQICRTAGGSAQIMAREGAYANIKLPSGEIRMISVECFATIGQVGNLEHEGICSGKAGRSRWLGIRPTVRGVAMNPIDHPMGGGEGRSSGGGPPVSPWGQLSKGKRTRRKRRPSSKFIVSRRKK